MKKIFSVFLIIAVLICNVNIYHVQASTNWFAVLTNAADVFVNTSSPTQQSTLQLINDFLQTNGFASAIANSVSPASDDIIKYFSSQIDASQANKTLQENIEAIRECVENGFTGGDSSVTFNNTLHNAIYNTANYYVQESSGKRYYCCDLQQSQQYFSTAEISNISSILQEYPNYIFYLFYNLSDGSNWLLGMSPNGGQLYGVCRVRYNNQDEWWSCIFYRAKSVNGIVSCERFVANSEDDMVAFYRRNGSGDNFEQFQLTYPWTGTDINSYAQPYDSCYFISTSGHSVDGNNFGQYPKAISMTNQSLLCFASDSALQTYVNTYGIGKQAYYYNNQVWSDFSNHTSGDYTVDNSNVNTVTYGDVISYVNDSHDTNNNYPDNSTVNTWIETTNNNNNSGGGSGDDSGGGSGGSGSDDSGSIFDWLKTLGKALGDLISGVGNFLSEIVAGLVDAITNLLDAITTLITGVLESLTNIFSGLIEFIFAGLPDDIRNVLSLALTVAILISVLKLIRGN